jgi:hypothetical protein
LKKIVLIFGILILALNTLIGLIVSCYQPFNFLMADLSIILTFAIVFWLTISNFSNALKIGLSFLFMITGLIRMICMIVMPSTWENNFLIIIVAGILFFELACFAIFRFINKK